MPKIAKKSLSEGEEQVDTEEAPAKSVWGWVVAVVVLVVLVLGLAGYLWWQSNNDQREQEQLRNQINALTNSALNNTVANTATNSTTTNSTNSNSTNSSGGSGNSSGEGMVSKINLYLIALDDGGVSGKEIGCNDSVVAVDKDITATSAPLRSAYEQLLSLDTRDYGKSGLVNALYNSDLTIDEVTIQNKVATVKLKGTLSSGGTCDDPRIIAQLTQTALQFASVASVQVYVNGQKLEDYLSTK